MTADQPLIMATGSFFDMGLNSALAVLEELNYQYTVEDARFYNQPWSGEFSLSTHPGPVYEYACHEGNYAMVGILRGARVADRDAEGI